MYFFPMPSKACPYMGSEKKDDFMLNRRKMKGNEGKKN